MLAVNSKKLPFLVVFFTLCLLSLSSLAYATVTVPPTWHGGKNPPDNCYISFSTTHTFNQVYRDENNFWFFDGYGFYVTNANATITDFFESDQNILRIRLSTSSSQAIAELGIKPANKGMPRFIIINQTTYTTPLTSKPEFDNFTENCWYYDSSLNLIYIKAELHSAVTITVGWTVVYPPYVSPQPKPTPTPTPEPTIQKPANETIIIIVSILAILIILILSRKRKSS